MREIALVLVCLILGFLLRLSGRLPDNAGSVLGGWVINIALPAAAFHSVHNLRVSDDWWFAAATPWLDVALAVVVIVPLSRAFGWSRRRTGALLLAGGWCNTSFVGLPLIAAYAGDQWMALGMVIDLCGSYLAVSTLGIAVASIAGASRLDWRDVVKRIVTFPPFLAILAAFATNHVDRPTWVTQVIDALALTLTPLAMAAVGYALRLDHIAGRLAPLSVGLGYRLLVAPLALVAMYCALGQAHDPVAKVAMLEMGMPPMLGASIIAMEHDLEPELVALLIGVGVPLSILTTWCWWPVILGL
ncbi:AEC family transporter [Mycobacterium sp. E2497]|uniref:AEC family transporter n=1 Tax=Mycobacterium sp. E2497 TaxID=1834135 RepID=UPI0007FF8CF3|nr:AEC family transporter [Mycobacterium sp. E2497]OBI15560.1 transporter [Mycobacterium sp. E2497]